MIHFFFFLIFRFITRSGGKILQRIAEVKSGLQKAKEGKGFIEGPVPHVSVQKGKKNDDLQARRMRTLML